MIKPPTLEEWKEIGNKTKEISKNIHELSILLSEKLPNTDFNVKLNAAKKAYGKLRTQLDEIVSNQYSVSKNVDLTHIII